MKVSKKKYLLSILICLVGIQSYAEDPDYDIVVNNSDNIPIYYKYINEGTELEVSYEYSRISYYDDYFTYEGHIVIPEEVTYMGRTRKVTSIGDMAFRNCRKLISVKIPNSVKSIGENAFSNCDLESITIGNGLRLIKRNAFYREYGEWKLKIVNISDVSAWCAIKFENEWANPIRLSYSLYVNGEIAKSLVIPQGVTSVSDYAFNSCNSIESIILPNSVISIGKYSFSGCMLTSLTFPNSIINIDNHAFQSCTNLVSITIPNSVTTIGDYAFSNCI